MSVTKWILGFDKSDMAALQESQQIDAEQFQKVFSALKEWQEAQKIDAKQFEEVFSALKEKIGTEQFQGMQEHLNGLQEKVETLTETVADQEKTLLICAIVSAVAAIAITSFVAFCIYQGIKCEREKEKNLSQDTPGTKLDADGGTKLNNLEVNGLKSVNDIAA